MQPIRCPNDNHGRSIIRIRFCPNCGVVVNGAIRLTRCSQDSHAGMRRSRSTYCMDCGERLAV